MPIPTVAEVVVPFLSAVPVVVFVKTTSKRPIFATVVVQTAPKNVTHASEVFVMAKVAVPLVVVVVMLVFALLLTLAVLNSQMVKPTIAPAVFAPAAVTVVPLVSVIHDISFSDEPEFVTVMPL